MFALALVVEAAAVDKRVEAPTIGANVAVALGPVERGRVGFGVDGGYLLAGYSERYQPVDGEMVAWAEERLALHRGPVVHVWWVGASWQASAGARLGVTWPMRVGLTEGWQPGPSAGGELAAMLSTAGHVGVDFQGVLEGPWVQVRSGATVVPGAPVRHTRVHAGGYWLVAPPVSNAGWGGHVAFDPDRTPP